MNRESENTKAQMRKGVLEFCMLLMIGKGRMYATKIIKELKKADLIVVEGTIYPLLSRMKKAGLLDYTWEESPSGPPRKYYTLTKDGEETLMNLEGTWKTFSNSINELIKKHYQK